MPRRNTERIDSPESFYHIYARGVNKMVIFNQSQDFAAFLNLLKRYLNDTPTKDTHGQIYPHLHGSIELLAYCLMPTHFHLLVYQQTQGSLQKLMQGVMTSYGMYFNKTYD